MLAGRVKTEQEAQMTQTGARPRAQAVYFSHGGGPLPILGDASHQAMVDFMIGLPAQLARPEAIVVVSAHWEEQVATLLGAPEPAMFYDYYGFPREAYRINYPAPGDPALATRMAALLEENGMAARLDPRRGFDHGLFIPLKLMYPEADIPAIQLSLLRGLDAAAHVALGRALRGLLGDNVLVVGSGFSFHNMAAFWGQAGGPDAANEAFQDWLIETCAGPLSDSEREGRLVAWEQAPSARYCHPREEHLLPLHVCAGMMGSRPAELVFDDRILHKRAVAFLWR
jgi:aromatic ring-opening dioxygenase catalytic subunit (LigB family)